MHGFEDPDGIKEVLIAGRWYAVVEGTFELTPWWENLAPGAKLEGFDCHCRERFEGMGLVFSLSGPLSSIQAVRRGTQKAG